MTVSQGSRPGNMADPPGQTSDHSRSDPPPEVGPTTTHQGRTTDPSPRSDLRPPPLPSPALGSAWTIGYYKLWPKAVRVQLVGWRGASQTFVSSSANLLERDRKVIFNAVHSRFWSPLVSVSVIVHLLPLLIVNPPSSTRHPTVRLHRSPTTSSTEVRTSTLVLRLQHLSCRELCNVLSSACQKKKTSSPSSLRFLYKISF